ncbi:MAG: cytochrome ubiquinol oxidase subunit I [Gaiellaceae bacterium]
MIVAVQEHLNEVRQMQTLSFVAHIPLVCFAISFPAMVLFTEWRWLRTGDEVYRTIARRWTRILIALFAVGVVTGTILSFEFGLLWPDFMARYASVFGLAFGIEGFAFFMEAIFIGLYVYGWSRFSPGWHFASGIPIALAGILGSAMVISVNGWMNHPTGFRLDASGKAVDVHPVDALFLNSYFWHELVHMYVAGYMVMGFVVAGVYAIYRARGRWGAYERTAFAIPLAVAALASPVQVLVGDWAGRDVAHEQPIKLAALEDLEHTTRGAPLHLAGGIEIPRLLSLLATHDPNAVVQGLDTVPPDRRPPVTIVQIAFRVMVAIGLALGALGIWFLAVRWRRGRLPESAWFYRGVIAAGPLALVALVAGWIVTEVGRQPWVVYRLMLTKDAVTRAPVVPVGYVTLALVYLGLAVAVAWILRRLARAPLPER